MQTASFEAAFPILGRDSSGTRSSTRCSRRRSRSVSSSIGNIVWIALRLTLVATVFAIVVVAFGREPVAADRARRSPRRSSPAWRSRRRSWPSRPPKRTPSKFASLFRFGITPLFLFSGTFFPIESLPAFIQPIAWLSPLWHGVDLCRALMLGTVGPPDAIARRAAPGRARAITVGAVRGDRPVEARLVAGRRAVARHDGAASSTPLFGFGSRRALRIIERNLLVYKHGWLVLFSGFFEPLFYLLSDRVRARRARR